jgi:hypothetical protein
VSPLLFILKAVSGVIFPDVYPRRKAWMDRKGELQGLLLFNLSDGEERPDGP